MAPIRAVRMTSRHPETRGAESNFVLAQRLWQALSRATDPFRADPSPKLLPDHSAEAVVSMGLLMLNVSADSVGSSRPATGVR